MLNVTATIHLPLLNSCLSWLASVREESASAKACIERDANRNSQARVWTVFSNPASLLCGGDKREEGIDSTGSLL